MLQGMNILYENNSLVHYYFPIVQWGSINIINGTGFYTLNFPITFNSLYTIVDGGIFDVEIQSRNNSSFKIEQRSGQSSDIYCYIALGK